LNNSKDKATKAIPAMMQVVTTVPSGSYLCAVGISSFIEIIIIISHTRPNNTAYTSRVITLAKITYPITAAIYFRHSRDADPKESLQATSCWIVDRQRNTQPFRDVMNTNGDCQYYSRERIVQRSNKGGTAFREVVDGYVKC
jgi:hypothetical protein